jgi:hypothetical protein
MISRVELGSRDTKEGVGRELIVVSLPRSQLLAGVGHGREQVFVEAFVTQANIKTLNEDVLVWLARRDIMPLDTVLPAHLKTARLDHVVEHRIRNAVFESDLRCGHPISVYADRAPCSSK